MRLAGSCFGLRLPMLYVNCNHEWAKWRAVRLCDLHVRNCSSGKPIFRRDHYSNEFAWKPASGHCTRSRSTIGMPFVRRRLVVCVSAVVGDRGPVPDQRLYQLQISDTYIRMNRRLACLKERCNSRLIKPFLEIR